MQAQYQVSGYRTDFYFHDYNLAIEIDELGHNDRNIDHEIQRQKAIEKELGFEFIRINPDEQKFDIFKAIYKIHRHIKKSAKNSLIGKISKALLEIDFWKYNSIKSKVLKYIAKKKLSSL